MICAAILRIFARFKAQNRKELRSRPVFVIVVLHLNLAEWEDNSGEKVSSQYTRRLTTDNGKQHLPLLELLILLCFGSLSFFFILLYGKKYDNLLEKPYCNPEIP